jgi:hypothetical protein
MSDSSNSQIEQNVKGNRNQAIGLVLGGMVVYGTVIYNNPPTEADSSTTQTKDPKQTPTRDCWLFRKPMAIFRGLHENIDYCELLPQEQQPKTIRRQTWEPGKFLIVWC